MAFPRVFDRVMETWTGTGTSSPITLAGAVTGHQTFAVVGDGNPTTYYIEGVDSNGVPTGEWEANIGNYTASGTTLSRSSTPYGSSNSGNLVNFSAGTKRVTVSMPAIFGRRAMLDSLGFIDGLVLAYSSATVISFPAGTLDVNGKVLPWTAGTFTSGSTMKDIANGTVTLEASSAYNCYVGDVSGTATHAIEKLDGSGDGAAATYDTDLRYFKAPSTGAAWRRIGKFWTDGSANILYFLVEGRGRRRRTLIGGGPALISNGTQTTFTAVTTTPYYQADDDAALLLQRNNISTGTDTQVYTQMATDGGTAFAVSHGSMLNTSGQDEYFGVTELPWTNTLHYKVSSGANGRSTITAVGFIQYV